jgi:hypothetical protein
MAVANIEPDKAARLACGWARNLSVALSYEQEPGEMGTDRRALLAAVGVEAVSLLRDIFVSPFHPGPALPAAVLAYSDHLVPRLAQSIYDDRRLPEGTLDSGRLAILADALLDAGADTEELLSHLRSEGPHYRGCWGVDLVLGLA